MGQGIGYPISDERDRTTGFIAVCRDILSGNIADEALVPEWLCIEYQAGFSALRWTAKPLCTEKQAEFERHVEPWQPVFIRLYTRDVMDTPAAIADEFANSVEAGLTGVVNLQRGMRRQTANRHCEHDGIEHRPVGQVERAIDKNTAFIGRVADSYRRAGFKRHDPPFAERQPPPLLAVSRPY